MEADEELHALLERAAKLMVKAGYRSYAVNVKVAGKEKMYAFMAYDLHKSKPALEEGEEIEVEQASLDDAIAMIKTGEIADAKTIATLLIFDRFHRGS